MSAIWLDAPAALGAPSGEEDVRLVGCGPVEDLATLSTVLDGHEVVVTASAGLLPLALERCRWIRAIVGITPDARDPTGWGQIVRRDLLTALVVGEGEGLEARVRLAVAELDQRLRAFDAIADDWEGT